MTATHIEVKRTRAIKPAKAQMLTEFAAAPDYSLFAQAYLAAIRDCSEATIERDRWAGGGIPFIRINGTRQVRYRKADILGWLESQTPRGSTTEADQRRAAA